VSAAGSSYFLKAGITPKVFASGQDPHELIHRFLGPHYTDSRKEICVNPRQAVALPRLLRNLRICSAPFAGRHGRRYSFQFIDFKYEKLILRLYLEKRGSRVAESPAPVLLIV